ncbi:MAG TPA: response regulator [Bryobacteraceae bacterium]|nr:response regulator [Bryobacteraceae bacterium]
MSQRPFPAPVPSASGIILIVEDYQELRTLIGEILKEAGYRISEASNGAEGLSRLREGDDIGLVITDLAMPGMDGHAFAEQIRQGRPDIKIIFMSADPEPLLERIGDWGEGIGLLRKPFTDEQLIACVEDTLKPS